MVQRLRSRSMAMCARSIGMSFEIFQTTMVEVELRDLTYRGISRQPQPGLLLPDVWWHFESDR
jgi:hypothetical protein